MTVAGRQHTRIINRRRVFKGCTAAKSWRNRICIPHRQQSGSRNVDLFINFAITDLLSSGYTTLEGWLTGFPCHMFFFSFLLKTFSSPVLCRVDGGEGYMALFRNQVDEEYEINCQGGIVEY